MKTFRIHDTRIYIQGDNLRPLYHRLLNILRGQGFVTVRDPFHAQFFPRSANRLGTYKDLQFVSEINSWGGKEDSAIAIEFFQDLVTENPSGGRWDFSKLQKMSYILRLRYLKANRAICTFLTARGFTHKVEPENGKSKAEEFIAHKIKTNCHFRGGDPLRDWNTTCTYNNQDRDKRTLQPGQVKYFYSYTGHLQRGTIYYNLNNMWWVKLDTRHVANIGSFELFDYTPGTPRRRPVDLQPKLERALKAAVAAQNYERAIQLRDLLARTAPTAKP